MIFYFDCTSYTAAKYNEPDFRILSDRNHLGCLNVERCRERNSGGILKINRQMYLNLSIIFEVNFP